MSLTLEELKWATILALTEPPQRSKPKEEPVEGSYLTFHSDDGEFTLGVYNQQKNWDGTLEWSIDTTTWIEWTGATTLSSSGGYLYMRGVNNSRIASSVQANRWVLTGESIACIGNIENLLDYTLVVSGTHPVMDGGCYRNMFYGCSSLTAAPELPATTLTNGCYSYMFYGCSSLTTTPELPATTLASDCYSYMFYSCSGLTTAPELPATIAKEYCYRAMFAGCTSLTAAPELPATTLERYCYADMFAGCTSLTAAPELPATTLPEYCYFRMFQLCKGLTSLPNLPATTLSDYCYYFMFQGCTSLCISDLSSALYQYVYRIPTIGTGTTAYSFSLYNMFSGTGGPFTGTPEINTTYYTDHEPV